MKNKRKVMRIIWWIYIVLLFLIVVIKFRGSFSELRERMNYYSMENSINYHLYHSDFFCLLHTKELTLL